MVQKTVNLTELPDWVGQDLGTSDWHVVTQDDVDAFGRVTHDEQWIHCDVERAAQESRFGQTIAHGYYTLSLIPHFMGQILDVAGAKFAVNYGINRLRYPAPVPVGSRVRGHLALNEVSEVKGGLQVVIVVTIEVEGAKKPACHAECVYRYYA